VRAQRTNGTTRIPRTSSSEEESFTVGSSSSLAGKYLKSDDERFDKFLQLANETSLVDSRVSGHLSIGNMLSLPIFSDPD
jgi:hypothetical protein